MKVLTMKLALVTFLLVPSAFAEGEYASDDDASRGGGFLLNNPYQRFTAQFERDAAAWRRTASEGKEVLSTCRAGETGSSEERDSLLKDYWKHSISAVVMFDQRPGHAVPRLQAADGVKFRSLVAKAGYAVSQPVPDNLGNACAGAFQSTVRSLEGKIATLKSVQEEALALPERFEKRHSSIKITKRPFGPPLKRIFLACDKLYGNTLAALNKSHQGIVKQVQGFVDELKVDIDRLESYKADLEDKSKNCSSIHVKY
jgi:hypothetical protein